MWINLVPTSEGVVIDDSFMDLCPVLVQIVLQVHLRGIVGVRAENHAAVLPVKRKICHLQIFKRLHWSHLLHLIRMIATNTHCKLGYKIECNQAVEWCYESWTKIRLMRQVHTIMVTYKLTMFV